MPAFSDVLSDLRRERGLTQQELADRLTEAGGGPVTRSAVGMWEAGRRVPKLDVLETVADFFAVDMDTLMGRGTPPAPPSPGEAGEFPEVTLIARAGRKMSPERRADMLRLLKIAFPEEFGDD